MDRLRELNPLHNRYGYASLIVVGAAALAIGFLVRSELFLYVASVVLTAVGWAGMVAGALIAITGVAAVGAEREWWSLPTIGDLTHPRRRRGISSSGLFVLALLFFFLPWAGVSCFDTEIGEFSGAELMGIVENDDLPRELYERGYDVKDAIASDAVLLYIAVLLLIVGAGTFALSGKNAKLTRIGLSAGVAVCVLLFTYLTLQPIASELGVNIGELDEAGIEISLRVGAVLLAAALASVVVVQLVPFPGEDGTSDSVDAASD